ncbi:MAG: Na/Pi cotransporter family protein [Merdibacter sp.]
MGEIVEIVVSMLGGLALFLYGMRMMSNGLELTAGNSMKSVLEKLTSNRIISILVGAGVTALVQSSSATTVMLVSFVGSSIMTLEQAVWIIMGANIGATMTNMLTALNMSMVASLLAIIGVIAIVFIKRPRFNHIGLILAGLGILFIGMELMSAAVMPLREFDAFHDIMSTFTNPLIGVLFGALFTALIQSSSASIGILQSLSITGAISMDSSLYLIFGMNIGTCITAALASIGANSDAKRTALIHFLFNVISTFLFIILIQLVPFASWMQASSGDPKVQIANANIVYKAASVLLLFPFGQRLVDLSRRLIRDDQRADLLLCELGMDRYGGVGTAAVALTSFERLLDQMTRMAFENVKLSLDALIRHEEKHREELYEREQRINASRHQINEYMNRISALELSEADGEKVISYFKITTDLERLGDHAKNLMGHVEEETLNEDARTELVILRNLFRQALQAMVHSQDPFTEMAAIETQADALTSLYEKHQLQRLRAQACTPVQCVTYVNVLTDIERIFDHLTNIMEECRDHGYPFPYALDTASSFDA